MKRFICFGLCTIIILSMCLVPRKKVYAASLTGGPDVMRDLRATVAFVALSIGATIDTIGKVDSLVDEMGLAECPEDLKKVGKNTYYATGHFIQMVKDKLNALKGNPVSTKPSEVIIDGTYYNYSKQSYSFVIPQNSSLQISFHYGSSCYGSSIMDYVNAKEPLHCTFGCEFVNNRYRSHITINGKTWTGTDSSPGTFTFVVQYGSYGKPVTQSFQEYDYGDMAKNIDDTKVKSSDTVITLNPSIAEKEEKDIDYVAGAKAQDIGSSKSLPGTDLPFDNPLSGFWNALWEWLKNIWLGICGIPGSIVGAIEKVGAFIQSIPKAIELVGAKIKAFELDFTLPKDAKLDFKPLMVGMDKFPFCIPWDFVALFRPFSSSSAALPVFVVNFPSMFGVAASSFSIDFTIGGKMDKVAAIFRYFILLTFVYALINKTRTMIRG